MNIFFFGDSICFGQHVSLHKTWAVEISTLLNKQFGQAVVMNNSISGNTTRMALERMAYDVLSHGVEGIYIQFGLNDCNYWVSENGLARVGEACFKANLIEMIARARKAGAKSVMLATNHPTPKLIKQEHEPQSYQENNQRYNSIIREVAQEYCAILVDHEKHWQQLIREGCALESLLLADHIHLSEDGHKAYVQTFAEYLPEFYRQLGDSV